MILLDSHAIQLKFPGELLHHGRRAGDEEMTEIRVHHGRRVGDEEKTKVRVVSGETNLITHIETYQL